MDMKFFMLQVKLGEYLKKNPERLTKDEQEKLRQAVIDWYEKDEKGIKDSVADFLTYSKLVTCPSRAEIFAEHIKKKYSKGQYKKVLEVGAGGMCHVATKLSDMGYNMTVIDPDIRLTTKELRNRNIKTMPEKRFFCDEYAVNHRGTDISRFDVIIGSEPCMATEHMLRQAVVYDKPVEIALCYESHDGLDGTRFRTPEEWYDYLRKISSSIEIRKYDHNIYATNVKEM